MTAEPLFTAPSDPAYRDGSRLHRAATPTTCRACGAIVLRGLDADACAFTALADPRPVTAAGEVAALRDGRRTYDLDGRELSARDRWSIPGRPPTPRRPVLAAHRCHSPLPATWLAPAPDPAPDKEPF